MKVFEGNFNGNGKKIGIVCGRFNEFIVSKLLDGALDGLKRNGVNEEDIDILWVPGAFEIPFITKKLVLSNKYDGVITLGAVIKGATPHFDYVSSEVSKGVANIGLESKIPVLFGVLTVNTIQEAIERAGTKSGNKGFEVALSTLEMINLLDSFEESLC